MSHIVEKINCFCEFNRSRSLSHFPFYFNIFHDHSSMFILSIIKDAKSTLLIPAEISSENQFDSVTRTSTTTTTPLHSRHQRSQPSDFDEHDNGFDIENDGDELVQNPLDRGPYFDVVVSKNVTALVGSTAYLNCRVRNLGNKTVSDLLVQSFNDLIWFVVEKVTWIRHRDLHLLTVGKATYTSDNRFQSVKNAHTDEWALKVIIRSKLNCTIWI